MGLSVMKLHLRQTLNLWASLVAQAVKTLPAIQETQVPSLGREDLLEKEMATHSSIVPRESHGNRLLLYTTLPTPVLLPGESQGQGSLVGCHLWGRTESDTTEAT